MDHPMHPDYPKPGTEEYEKRRKHWEAGSMGPPDPADDAALHQALGLDPKYAGLSSDEGEEGQQEEAPAADTPADTADPELARADMLRWQRKALDRLKEGRPLTFTFQSPALAPEAVWEIRRGLATAVDADGVRAVFRTATFRAANLFGGDDLTSRRHVAHTWQARRLASEEHPLKTDE